MKKLRLLACAVACSVIGATFAFAACSDGSSMVDSTASGTSTDEPVLMTTEDVNTITTAFETMSLYEGGYTVKEDMDLSLSCTEDSTYNSTLATDSFVTYNTDGTMGYGSTLAGTNLYSAYNGTYAYYTLKNSDGSYTQYRNMAGTYSSVDYQASQLSNIQLYYTSFADMLENVFTLNVVDGAKLTTAEEIAKFWEDKAASGAETLSTMYGITLTFTSGDNTTFVEDNTTIYRFTASATASGALSGATVTDDVSYYVDIYLDTSDAASVKISKISIDMDQKLAVSQSGLSMTFTASSTCTDEFSYAYDSTLVPADFSAYTV